MKGVITVMFWLLFHCQQLFLLFYFSTVLEPMIIFVMGYLSYILADMFEFSGIVR